MSFYLWLKLTHIFSATLLFGTGMGTAYYMWRADRSGDIKVVRAVSREVVRADWLFTAPALVIQLLTGFAMMSLVGWSLQASWLLLSLALYLLVCLCWLPVVWIQIQVAKGAAAADAIPHNHRRLMRCWYALGWPALFAVLGIFYLMVFKPVLW